MYVRLCPRILQIVEVLIKHGCCINAENQSNHTRVIDHVVYWQHADPFHRWMTSHGIYICDLEPLTPVHDHIATHLPVYVRAGCTEPFALQCLVAQAMQGNDSATYRLALEADPARVQPMDMRWLFEKTRHILWEEFREPLADYINFGLYITKGMWCESPAQLARPHVYWEHVDASRTPVSLTVTCVAQVRAWLYRCNNHCSILPQVKQLPLPQKLKDILTFKHHNQQSESHSKLQYVRALKMS